MGSWRKSGTENGEEEVEEEVEGGEAEGYVASMSSGSEGPEARKGAMGAVRKRMREERRGRDRPSLTWGQD